MQNNLKKSLENILEKNDPFQCRVKRKHFFGDRTYILTLHGDNLTMG